MDDENQTDSEWLRLQRLESDRRAWAWRRLKSGFGWIAGALTSLWVGIDAVQKFVDWMTRK